MPDTLSYNLVKFAPAGGGASLSLRMDGEWVWTPGIKASVFTATVPFTEFDKLGASPVEQSGSLQFFFTSETAADLTLAKWTLIDTAPVEFRHVEGVGFRCIEYRLSFADARDRFAFPFGGSLNEGELNKEPLNKAGTKDANGNTVLRRHEMARICLKAMNASDTVVPHELSDVPPMFNVDWRGNPAPQALAELLDEVGFTFVVKADGSFAIEKIGSGAAPKPPAGRLFVDAGYPGIDRRGEAVVFSSAPLATIDTVTYNADDLEFVFTDGKDNWMKLADAPALKGLDPIDVVQNNFGHGRNAYGQPDHPNYEYFRRYLYQAVRLDPERFGPQPISRYSFDPVNALQTDIRVEGYQLHTAGPSPAAIATTGVIPPAALMGNGTVLVLPNLVGRLDPALDEFTLAGYRPPKGNELTVRATREVWDIVEETDPPRWRPSFYRIGFFKQLGKITRMSEQQIDDYLLNHKTGFLPRPELRERNVDGVPQNKTELETIARALADRFLGGDAPPKVGRVAGYFQAELSGLVNQVAFSPSPPTTSWKENSWFFPHEMGLAVRVPIPAPRRGSGGKFPKEAETAARRTAEGVASGQQPIVPLHLKAAPQGPTDTFLVHVFKIVSDAGAKYYGRPIAEPLTMAEAGNLAMPAGPVPPVTVADSDVLLINLLEDGKATHWVNYTRAYDCRIVGSVVDGAGKPTGRRLGRLEVPNPTEVFVCALTKTGGASGGLSTACTWRYTWKNLQGETLATDRQPQEGRAALGAMTAAGKGLAYYDVEGTFQPLLALEVPDVEAVEVVDDVSCVDDEVTGTKVTIVTSKEATPP